MQVLTQPYLSTLHTYLFAIRKFPGSILFPLTLEKCLFLQILLLHLFFYSLVIFDGAVEEVDDETQTEHFESIQSTNW